MYPISEHYFSSSVGGATFAHIPRRLITQVIAFLSTLWPSGISTGSAAEPGCWRHLIYQGRPRQAQMWSFPRLRGNRGNKSHFVPVWRKTLRLSKNWFSNDFFPLLAIGGVLEPAPALPCTRIIKLLPQLTKDLASKMENDLILLFWTKQRTVPIVEGENGSIDTNQKCQALWLEIWCSVGAKGPFVTWWWRQHTLRLSHKNALRYD